MKKKTIKLKKLKAKAGTTGKGTKAKTRPKKKLVRSAGKKVVSSKILKGRKKSTISKKPRRSTLKKKVKKLKTHGRGKVKIIPKDEIGDFYGPATRPPVEVRRPMNVKLNAKERERMIAKAKKFAAGNLSVWVRMAGLNYEPKS